MKDLAEEIKQNAVKALRQVYDPEISVNVYDLGLIYDIGVDEDNKVTVTMTLTAPNCPMADQIVEDAYDAILDVPGVSDAAIKIVFDPPWDKSRMSEAALLELGLL